MTLMLYYGFPVLLLINHFSGNVINSGLTMSADTEVHEWALGGSPPKPSVHGLPNSPSRPGLCKHRGSFFCDSSSVFNNQGSWLPIGVVPACALFLVALVSFCTDLLGPCMAMSPYCSVVPTSHLNKRLPFPYFGYWPIDSYLMSLSLSFRFHFGRCILHSRPHTPHEDLWSSFPLCAPVLKGFFS